jgi:hypothetical protein
MVLLGRNCFDLFVGGILPCMLTTWQLLSSNLYFIILFLSRVIQSLSIKTASRLMLFTEDQPVDIVLENNWCLSWESYEAHTYIEDKMQGFNINVSGAYSLADQNKFSRLHPFVLLVSGTCWWRCVWLIFTEKTCRTRSKLLQELVCPPQISSVLN